MKRLTIRRLVLGAVAGVCAALWALLIAMPHRAGQPGLADPVEAGLVNLRLLTFGAITPPEDVVIVAVDDATFAGGSPLGAGRGKLADIINGIANAGARLLVVDVLLTDAGTPQGDRALADALGKLPSVIAAGLSYSEETSAGAAAVEAEFWPLEMFGQASDVAIANIVTDNSAVPRHIPIVFLTSRGLQPSLAAKAASIFTGEALNLSAEALVLGPRRIPLDTGFRMPIRLAGPEATMTTISANHFLSDGTAPDLRDKAVVLGVTGTGVGDRFPTPFAPDLPGAEVVATALAQLIGGDVLRRDDAIRQIDLIATVLLAAACTSLALVLPLSIGISVAGALLTGWLALVWLAFPMGLWLSAALPLIGTGPPLLVAFGLRYAHERRRAARSESAVTELKRFQSPLLAEQIASNPDFLLAPESRELVVSFADLSGFTALSQELGAGRSEAFLKRFHTLLAEIAEDGNGVVLNFMGDGALVIFGVFDASVHPADDALNAAFRLVRETRELGRAEGFSHPLGCRIGLHYGTSILSRMGGERQQQLTVTGDSVNLCSRLLEIAKTESAMIAATSEFVTNLSRPPERAPTSTASLPVRGRLGQVDLTFWGVDPEA